MKYEIIKYEKMKLLVRRNCLYRTGYFGETTTVGIAFYGGIAWAVADCGYFRANSYKYKDEGEMLYYFDNHRNVHFKPCVRVLTTIEEEQIPSFYWQNFEFKTLEEMEKFLKKYESKITYNEILINNAYGIECKLLKNI